MKSKVTGCKELLRPQVSLSQPQVQMRSQGSLLNLKRILVPLDFSSTSLRTLRSVIPFAHKFASKLVLLHVVERMDMFGSTSSGQGTPEAALVGKAKEQMGMVLESEIGGVVSGEAHVRIGRPFLEIVAFARLHDIDLIVIGPYGESHLGQALLGSTAEKVMRHAPCPVLTLHEREPTLA